MTANKQLNTDILNEIVKYIDTDNIYTACKCLIPNISTEEIKYVRDSRLNPIVLLTALTSKPEALLVAMGLSGVFLSGSQAANYFYPGIISSESDWDFYCSEDIKLFKAFLTSIGTEWIEKDITDTLNSFSSEENATYHRCDVTVGIIKRGKNKETIQLIKAERSTPFENIIKFHSSIVQCFICIFGAVSMYGNLTVKGRSIPWETHINEPVFEEKTKNCRLKYISRGIKYISYEYYARSTVNNSDYIIDIDILNKRLRSIKDKDSKIILFDNYYSKEVRLLLEQRNIGFNLHTLLNLRWSELPYRCLYSNNRLASVQTIILESKSDIVDRLKNLYPSLSLLINDSLAEEL